MNKERDLIQILKLYTKKCKLKILEKIEKINTNDIEQNIKIQNGGSNIYAYLVEIS